MYTVQNMSKGRFTCITQSKLQNDASTTHNSQTATNIHPRTHIQKHVCPHQNNFNFKPHWQHKSWHNTNCCCEYELHLYSSIICITRHRWTKTISPQSDRWPGQVVGAEVGPCHRPPGRVVVDPCPSCRHRSRRHHLHYLSTWAKSDSCNHGCPVHLIMHLVAMATMSPGSKLAISSSNESHYHKLIFTFAHYDV